MDTNTLEKLARWSAPREIMTKNGPRLLRTADTTPEFSAAWKTQRDAMKALGASWSKDDRSGEWSLVWWQQLSDAEVARRKQAVEQSRAAAADIELPRPEGLDYMPFQKAGIRYALDRAGVLIGDEMGLGKTIQAIGIINADPAITSAVVVCPKSLMLNWQRELSRWLVRPLTVSVGSTDGDVVILNYESLSKHIRTLTARQWGAMIVDEAHYIKNKKTVRSENVKAIAAKSARNIRLTGTPIVNRPVELYNIICDLHPAWANFWNYAKRYCNGGIGYGGHMDVTGASNLDELQQRLRETVMVRRLKSQVLTELPRKIRQIIEVEADADQKAAIRREREHEAASDERLAALRAAVELSKAESEDAYRAAVARLTEASEVDFTELARLRHETALAKVPAVTEHVRAILEDDADQKVIIAAHHHDVIDQLANRLLDFYPVTLTGATKLEDRQTAVDRFQNDDRTRVFIGSITAAGVGITLTRANMVIFAELDWVPGNITQMEDRAHRIGQTETVLVQHLVLADSLDARMAQILVEKQKIIDSALDVNHPARKTPAYRPRQAAATDNETVDALAALAEKLTSVQMAAARAALSLIASMDMDRAGEMNGIGFNKIDTHIGHELAARAELTPKQTALAWKLATKYRNQLPPDLVAELKGE
mgnify:CR=1 FL=1